MVPHNLVAAALASGHSLPSIWVSPNVLFGKFLSSLCYGDMQHDVTKDVSGSLLSGLTATGHEGTC